MSNIVVNTFDLYNTTRYWTGYNFPEYSTLLQLASAYYFTQFSSNPYGSQIDFFKQLAGVESDNPTFQVTYSNRALTIDTIPYLWGKYWWDRAIYYSNTTIYNQLTSVAYDYYQPFSESVGTLYYLSRVNNLQNSQTKPYSLVIESLLQPDVSETINSFYLSANSLFLTNKAYIGPGTGTDTAPGSGSNSNLIQADTDLTRRITSNTSLTATVNNAYFNIYQFLPYNTTVVGNFLTPYFWGLSANCEGSTINVDVTNKNISTQLQLKTNELIAN